MGHPTGTRVLQYPSPQRAGRWKPALATFPPPPPAKPKLLDRLREALRSRHYSRRTEQTYCLWIKRFIYFHHVRHPSEMAEPEINAFLTYLAVNQRVSASTQNQALAALLFLYDKVLNQPLGQIEGVVRAHRPRRLPVVLTQHEGRAAVGGKNLSTTDAPRLIANEHEIVAWIRQWVTADLQWPQFDHKLALNFEFQLSKWSAVARG